MSSNPSDPQNDTSPSYGREPGPPTTKAAADTGAKLEAGAKLKEAQAKLLEAEAKLTDVPGPARRESTARNASGETPPKREGIGRDAGGDGSALPRTESVGRNDTSVTKDERREPAAKRVSDEAKEHLPSKPVTENLSENVAGMLCYLFGWVSGLVFLFIDRRPFVRFHAAQSVAIFATLNILILALGGFFLGALVPGIAGALYFLRHLLELTWLVAAVVLMLKVSGGERFRVKMASQYGDRAAHGAK